MDLSRSSSPLEERHFLESWTPEPLVPEVAAEEYQHVLNPHVITSKPGRFITIDGVECLNFGTNNYLGLTGNQRLEQSAIQALRKYGVGSCGPRAFYGTMDVHLELEKELAEFLNVQEAVLYSFGFSTIASAIPAYAKPSDIIFVDDCSNFAIQQGVIASKSKVIKFKHNDTKHLEQLIEESIQDQVKRFGTTKKQRTFLIVEGIYASRGDICPLRELIELKKRFKIRLFIDESRSFGVLGSEGKGVSQHFNVDINDIDLIMASLENALSAYGGFCAGSTYVIDHQRLAGSGYCFSASLPPFQARVALESLKLICDDQSIVKNAHGMYEYAQEVLGRLTKLKNISHPLSPIKLLVPSSTNPLHKTVYNKEDEKLLDNICHNILAEEHIALSVSRYIEEEEMTVPVASIRLVVNGYLIREDIDRVYQALERFSGC